MLRRQADSPCPEHWGVELGTTSGKYKQRDEENTSALVVLMIARMRVGLSFSAFYIHGVNNIPYITSAHGRLVQ